ncbi:MAG: N-formylglutamate deformylase [Woeseiaceae bacterium]|nr:N-formylglutamate deformylase [Woeseiaceae bacterium]
MTDCYSFHQGTSPLLVSVPHDGRELPESIAATMTDAGKALPDTDWHVARLYEFTKEIGASMIVANCSRYVVDLNRPADDASMYEGQRSTGLCPLQTFDGRDLYSGDASIDIEDRLIRYWRPYHDKVQHVLEACRDTHGYALLWDAHSITSRMPTLFEGELPILNIGTYDGRSCATSLSDAVVNVAQESPYDAVVNARFKGGHTTRHYGRPAQSVHAIQLELAQRAYMNEQTRQYDDEKASQLRDTLRRMLAAFTMPA